MRGNLDQVVADDSGHPGAGSIPACAGEPRSALLRSRNPARGSIPACAGEPIGPLQPHWLPAGSIPACAGEPVRPNGCTANTRVYPRLCGGTGRTPDRGGMRAGLSPPVRGNPAGIPRAMNRPGSIPACAGEPWRFSRPPRGIHLVRSIPACAGEPDPATKGRRRCSWPGLSPPVRGNRDGDDGSSVALGDSWGVYPRLCGGTILLKRGSSTYPRPRGSIPACAGEPTRGCDFYCWSGVYPRLCGGTPSTLPLTGSIRGLSPPVRGNHRVDRRALQPCHPGSIPACAGEPPPLFHHRPQHMSGLSPPVRGNH